MNIKFFGNLKSEHHLGEPIVIRMQIRNLGDRPFSIMDGGPQRGARNNQFRFVNHFHRGYGDPRHFGGLAGYQTLRPRQAFEKDIDVTKWYKSSVRLRDSLMYVVSTFPR